MTNCKETTNLQNQSEQPECINYALDHQPSITIPTLQRTVSAKTEITITRQQLIAAKQLFNDYDIPKPGWLRQKFYINQRRRKCLNVLLTEAQLDKAFCCHHRDPGTWYDLLHQLWHNINGESPCK